MNAFYGHLDLVRSLVVRDLVERYQRSFAGVGLALLMPVIVTAVLTAVFSGLMPERVNGSTGGVPWDYGLRVLVAYIAWDYASRSLSIAAETLRGHAVLIGKVRFPLAALPLATCLSVGVQLCLGLLLFLLANAVFGTGLHATALWLPVLVAIEVVMVVGLAMLAAAAGVLLQDFAHLLAIGLLIWFYGSAVFYSPSIVPSDVARSAIEWNPMFGLIDALRTTCIDGRSPDAGALLWMGGCAVGAFALGHTALRRARFLITEVLG